MSKGDDEDDYEVGYGKPPKEHQFKPGQSGNSNGRPKLRKNRQTIIKDLLGQPVKTSRNGRKRTITAEEALIQAQVQRAVRGDTSAFNSVMGLAERTIGLDVSDEASTTLGLDDQRILEDALQRFSKSKSIGDDDAQPEPDRPASTKTAKTKNSKGDET